MSAANESTDPPRPAWRKTVADWLWPWRIWPAIWQNFTTAPDCGPGDEPTPAAREALRQLGAHPVSITLRHLDCGSCNGCELQLIALSNPCYDMEQYGIAFESSPRHAVYLAMTGPFTRGLVEAAGLTLEAMPEPAIIAIGDCAVDGGYFRDSYAVMKRPAKIEEAIRHRIAGCPPSPGEILEALARIALKR